MSEVNMEGSYNVEQGNVDRRHRPSSTPWRDGRRHKTDARIAAVRQYQSGAASFSEICNNYDIWPSTLKRWLHSHGSSRNAATVNRQSADRQAEWSAIMRKVRLIDEVIADITKALKRLS